MEKEKGTFFLKGGKGEKGEGWCRTMIQNRNLRDNQRVDMKRRKNRGKKSREKVPMCGS